MPSLFLVLFATALLFRMQGVRISTRLAGSMVCLLIAFWINMSSASVAVVLILCVDLSRSHPRAKLRLGALLALAVALAANVWFARRYPGPNMMVFEPPRLWLVGLQRLSAGAVPYFFHQDRVLIFVISLSIVILLQFTRRRISRNYKVEDVLVFFAVSIALAVAIAGTEWVKLNEYDPRYWTISVMLLLFLATGWVSSAIVRLLTNMMGSQHVALFLSGSLLVGLVLNIFGFPSYTKAKSYLSDNIDRFDRDERALGCTHFVGSYWVGWTSVFQRESSGGPPLYAITNRAGVIRDRWNWEPSRPRTYCGIPGDPEREIWSRIFGLPPLRESTRSGGLCKLEVVPRS
jgi:hypothetical protein